MLPVDFSSLQILSGDLWGGAEIQMYMQISALKRAGSRVSTIFFNEGETSRRFREAGLEVHIASEGEGIYQLIKKSIALAKEIRPSVIVAHGYKETFVGRMVSIATRIPLIPTIHGWSENYRGLKNLKMSLYSKMHLAICKGAAARVITVTHSLAKELGLERLSKLRVVYNVTDSHLSPEEIKSNRIRFFGARTPAIVAVGRLVPVKQFDLAIAAMKQLLSNPENPRAHLYIIGEGPERSKLERCIASFGVGDNVHLLGFQSDAASYISSSDGLIISSRSEGLPTVLLEALVAGTQVISVDLPGIREIAERFAIRGIHLAQEPTADALAESIRNVAAAKAEEIEERESLRELFSPDRAALNLLDIFAELRAQNTQLPSA